MEECIFCKIVGGEVSSKKVFENELFLAFFDANPKVEGHSLIIPKKHFENILDFDPLLGEELIYFVKKVFEILKKDFGAEGFNIVQNNFKPAGQVVNHLHFHILPRKIGDGYSLGL
ncbi:MAG TPA: HIT family protein [Candidatus Nanoarchaeia archaeon]|nr:HIT family protein [Candidatus Nanoarchaeia archaeon]